MIAQSGTSTMWAQNTAYRGVQSPHALIKGVCARIADRAGVPVWMPRTAFVIFGLLHWFFALVAYIVMSKLFCPARSCAAGNSVPPNTAGFTAPQNDVRNRFANLDRRLAEMEAATLQQEASLRRAFRDLERN